MKYAIVLLAATLLYFGHHSMQASPLEIVNDGIHNIFITDHMTHGCIIKTGETGMVGGQDPVTMYVYVESNNAFHTYTLLFRVKEEFCINKKTTMMYNDIASGALETMYPGRFTITHQSRLVMEEVEEFSRQYDQHQQEREQRQPRSSVQTTYNNHTEAVDTDNIPPQLLNAIMQRLNQQQSQPAPQQVYRNPQQEYQPEPTPKPAPLQTTPEPSPQQASIRKQLPSLKTSLQKKKEQRVMRRSNHAKRK